MSKIIKASFEPIMGVVGPAEDNKHEELHSKLLPPQEAPKKVQGNPAAAIIDSALVMSTAQARAAEILREAEEQAVGLVVAAEEETGRVRREAEKEGYATGEEKGYEQGYSAGYREGVEAAQKEFQEDKQTIRNIIEECHALRAKNISQSERDIVILSLAIAEKIARRQFEESPEDSVEIVITTDFSS